VIDGDSAGSVVRFVNSEDSTATITGFTIQGGAAWDGAGIFCLNSNPNISYNIIRNNVGSYGSGIFCSYSDPKIEKNIIKENYGSGIHCEYSNSLIQENMISENWHNVSGGGLYCRAQSSPIIMNNFFIGNSTSQIGGGIFCISSTPIIFNNTFSENSAPDGGALHTRNASPQVYNTIFWNNSDPQISSSMSGGPIVTYCDVEGGFTGEGNIDLPPLFVNPDEGDYNVCSQSPCIDTGDPAILDPDGTRSDIGVFFFEHPNCESGNRWYISTSGNDSTGDGTLQNPFRTIQHGINMSAFRDSVIVLNGIYHENIEIVNKSIVLTSNYIFTEDSLDIVNTIIDGNNLSSAVTFQFCDDLTSIIGFTITNGTGQDGGGVNCRSSNVTIRNNIINNNVAEYGSGGGIYCLLSNPEILYNEISNNTAYDGSPGSYGGGVCCYYSSPLITDNIIKNNSADGGGGISCTYFSDPLIMRNEIRENFTTGTGTTGGGIHCAAGSYPIIRDNLIIYNSAENSNGGGIAAAISGGPLIVGNEILYNAAGASGGGIYVGFLSTVDSINYNLIAGNTAIHYGAGICIYGGDPPTILGNTICNNSAEITGGAIYAPDQDVEVVNTLCWYNSKPEISGAPNTRYSNIEGGFNGIGNINIIPMIIDPISDNYNICSGSPCIDTGDPAINDPDGTRSDIGKYYSDHPDCPPLGNKIYVSINGDDSTGNGTPVQPYRTIVYTINQAYYHDTVVVFNGSYNENINFYAMRISLVSNFVFTGDSLDIQNTIIDGDSLEPVITFDHNEDSLVSVTGFTIKNGLGSGIFCNGTNPNITGNHIEQNYGMGIFCNLSDPIIRQNKIRNNYSTMGGGGIRLERSSPNIGYNDISGNYTEGSGAGIYCVNRSDALIYNNNIINNSSDNTGGAIYCENSIPQIENNNIINNSAIKHGGGIYYLDWYNYNTTVSNNVISENIAQIGAGVWIKGNMTLIENNIYFNESDSIGGGIYCEFSSPLFYDNNVGGNNALWGGGIAIFSGSPEIYMNFISENVAEFEGGGIYSYDGKQLSILNQIIGNIANFGAGIMAVNNWMSRSYNNLIAYNSASSNGGGIGCTGSNHHIVNNTITNNTADFSGGGLYIENNSSIYASNVILWSNYSQTDPEISIDSISVLDINFSDIQGGYPGNGNINTDPLFRNPANDDFHLMSTGCGDPYDSPCIDSGNPIFSDSLMDCMWGLGTAVSDIGVYGGGYRAFLEIEDENNVFPSKIILNQNYPNPFNSLTIIEYGMSKAGYVRINVFDLLGRKVETLVDEEKQAGQHQAVWDASGHSSGVYFYRIEAGEFTETKKMILLK
jgi:parallel beta-helix repeat protein/predicted outer membrane repeat protein